MSYYSKTLSSLLGKFINNSDSSIRYQEEFLEKTGALVEDIADGLSKANINRYPFPLMPDTWDKFYYMVEHELGGWTKISNEAASGLLSIVGSQGLAYTSDDGAPFCLYKTNRTPSVGFTTLIKSYPGDDSTDYGIYSVLIQQLTSDGKVWYYVNNNVFTPKVDTSDVSYFDYRQMVIVPVTISDDGNLIPSHSYSSYDWTRKWWLYYGGVPYYSDNPYVWWQFSEKHVLGYSWPLPDGFSPDSIMQEVYGSTTSRNDFNTPEWMDLMNVSASETFVCMSLLDLVKQTYGSKAINGIHSFIGHALCRTNAMDSIVSFLSSINSTNSSVRGYAEALKSKATLSKSSFASYFMTIISDGCSVTSSDSGGIEFTNNDKLVPKLFLSGIIKSAIIAAAQLISTIVSAIITYVVGPIAGLIVLGVSSIFSGLKSTVDSSVYAQIHPDPSLEAVKFGIWQFSNIQNNDTQLQSELNDFGFKIFDLPFAKVFVWKSNDYGDGYCNCEIHLTPVSQQWAGTIFQQIKTRIDNADGWYIV